MPSLEALRCDRRAKVKIVERSNEKLALEKARLLIEETDLALTNEGMRWLYKSGF
jgi:hypothetical protein